MKMNSTSKKRESTSQSPNPVSKKLRSDLPRRRRSIFSPFALQPSKSDPSVGVSTKVSGFSVSVNSITCEEVSCNTTRDSIAEAGNRNVEFHMETRSGSKKKETERLKWRIGGEGEVSESSCVESCSIAEVESKMQSKMKAESGGDSFQLAGVPMVQDEANLSGIVEAVAVPNSASTIEQSNGKRSGSADSVLVCSENLSDGDSHDFSSSTFSEFQSETLGNDSDLDFFSDTSVWTDNSGSQFSLQSTGDSSPSPLKILNNYFSEQLIRLSSYSCNSLQRSGTDEFADEFTYWRFEDEDDEQSYQRLRSRERKRSMKMDDYVTEYASKTEYGLLIHEQRLLMVDWIVETSEMKELHKETAFLAIRLLDRFLSKRFFNNKKTLEIVGIACLTLATRIEENQPNNCILQKIFNVKENFYDRTEVVAMEWLVQKELHFQCFSPTTYNFLWFYLKAASADEEMKSLAKHLTELAMFDHNLIQLWPSTLAAGIVMLASLAAKRDESCLRVIEVHIRTNTDDLLECIKSLEWLVKFATYGERIQ